MKKLNYENYDYYARDEKDLRFDVEIRELFLNDPDYTEAQLALFIQNTEILSLLRQINMKERRINEILKY